MITVALANFKGGVGKTTLSITLAAALAGMGYKVGIVDTDPQGNVATWFGLPEESGLYNLLIEKRPLTDVLRLVPRAQWWPDETSGALGIVPGNISTTTAGVTMILNRTPATALRDALAPLAAGMDYLILDTAPTVTELAANVYLAANYLVIPTETQRLSVNGTIKTLETVTELQRDCVLGIVPTKHKDRQLESRANLASLHADFPSLIWEPIANRTAWEQAPGYGKSIFVQAGKRAAAFKEALHFTGEFLQALQRREVARA